MEIENSRVVALATPANDQEIRVDNQRKDRNQALAENTGNGAGSSDKISFTSEASKLQILERELASRPVIDGQRVNAVRSAIDKGAFEVNPERIAEKIISLEQALTDAR